MIYKNLFINVLIRVILLSITCYLFVVTIYETSYYVVIANLAILILLQIVLLIYYMNRVNRDLSDFFLSVRSKDSSLEFPLKRNRAYQKIYKSLNDVNKLIQEIQIEKENQYYLLNQLVENIDVGILTFDDEGNVELINETTKQLFGIDVVKNIKSLRKVNTELPTILFDIKPSEQQLFKFYKSHETINISIRASIFKIQSRTLKLLSLQNIKQELEEKEIESWQKVIRVITHEISNSIAPISSLTTTLSRLFRNEELDKLIDVEDISISMIEKTLTGLHVIEQRSNGIKKFINSYRSLTKLPKPVIRIVSVNDLFQKINVLLNDSMINNQINFEFNTNPLTLKIAADEKMIEQIIINLMNNAIDALNTTQNKRITLKAFETIEEDVLIQVIDNGVGIIPEEIDEIFTPFYTTKETGSGIGLSLSKQFMMIHNGTISVNSSPDKETIFTLRF